MLLVRIEKYGVALSLLYETRTNHYPTACKPNTRNYLNYRVVSIIKTYILKKTGLF